MQVQNQPDSYLIDCGALQSFSIRHLQRVRAVFVSHTHVDHWIDFDTLLRHQVQHATEVTICGPAGITEHVGAKLRAYNWNLLDHRAVRYRVREIVACDHVLLNRLSPPHYTPEAEGVIDDASPYQDESIRVDCALLDHHIPSVAYRFSTPERVRLRLGNGDPVGGPWAGALKQAFEDEAPDRPLRVEGRTRPAGELFHLVHRHPGSTAGVILDHAITPDNRTAIRTLFEGVDTVYIESYYLERDRTLALNKAHSTAADSARVLSGLGITNAYPIHHSRKYSEIDIARLHEEFYLHFRP